VYTCYVYSGGALAKFEISIPVLNYLVQILLDFLRPKIIFPSHLSSILSTYKIEQLSGEFLNGKSGNNQIAMFCH
jgi:hypothetical protein